MIKNIQEWEQYKPFLRWAGGKSWLTKRLSKLNELEFNQYHEPFLGGGATYFYLQRTSRSYLSDLNEELINTYIAVRDNVEKVISCLRDFKNTKDFYYKIRETKFTERFENAAKFIYLNQTSFNGIYRVNLKGVYNVPYGFRSKEFLDENTLINASKALKNASIFVSDFEVVKQNIRVNDLVFLDPPYTVSHNNNGFIKYNEKLFSIEDQYRLSKLIDFIREKGAYYILTNAAHNQVRDIFNNSDSVIQVSRANLIGGINAKRGSTEELIFTNISLQ